MEGMPFELADKEELFITGEILAIYFSNPTNFYKVILIELDDTNSDYIENNIVITGNFGQIQEGASYTFYGEFIDHPKFGVQFKANHYKSAQPSTNESLINYLSSDLFKGVGIKTAEKIIDQLGIDAIDKIVENENILDNVPGVSKKQKSVLIDVLAEEYGTQKIILALNKYGIDNRLAFRIYAEYEEETMELILENPYKLVQEIEGISFQRADQIAEQIEIQPDADERIQAGILFTLFMISESSGDTYGTFDAVVEETIRVLESSRSFLIDKELVQENISQLIEKKMLYEDENRYFLSTLYNAEWGIVNSLEQIINQEKDIISEKKISKKLKEIEKELNIEYGDSQKEAIKKAIESPLFILNGGPGTGKTTVLEGIIHLFADLNDLSLDPYSYKDTSFPILLGAPTGRAAKRMEEMTGLPASTIHRMLGLTADDDELFNSNDFVLEGKLVIIDEMSMVDTYLANQLFQSIPNDMKVILVGDEDQLPSVGPGQVFRDLIDSGKIPQKELIDIYRQGDDSSIIPLAHEIKHNRLPADLLEKRKDRNFFSASVYDVVPVIETIVSAAIKRGYTSKDIQILAPMYKGPAGINKINERLQDIFNPNNGTRKEVKHIETIYRIGDKILQLQNDPENNVFNGDVGEIVSITKANESDLKTDEIIVDFSGNEVVYLRSNWNKITLAYCCSIHKAQGSEYDIVLFPLVRNYGRMLKKDLLYTAVTRATNSLSLIGEPQAFIQSIQSQQNLRNTALKEKFQYRKKERMKTNQSTSKKNIDKIYESENKYKPESRHKNSFILTSDMIKQQKIDPMIGMDRIKP